MSNEWIVVDRDGSGSTICKSLDLALAVANTAIQDWLGDEYVWPPEVKDVHITHDGKVTHKSTPVALDIPDEIQEAMDDDPDYVPPADQWCDYVMAPVRVGA